MKNVMLAFSHVVLLSALDDPESFGDMDAERSDFINL